MEVQKKFTIKSKFEIMSTVVSVLRIRTHRADGKVAVARDHLHMEHNKRTNQLRLRNSEGVPILHDESQLLLSIRDRTSVALVEGRVFLIEIVRQPNQCKCSNNCAPDSTIIAHILGCGPHNLRVSRKQRGFPNSQDNGNITWVRRCSYGTSRACLCLRVATVG